MLSMECSLAFLSTTCGLLHKIEFVITMQANYYDTITTQIVA